MWKVELFTIILNASMEVWKLLSNKEIYGSGMGFCISITFSAWSCIILTSLCYIDAEHIRVRILATAIMFQ